jgi:hypothetical protein
MLRDGISSPGTSVTGFTLGLFFSLDVPTTVVRFQPRNCGVSLQTLVRLVKEQDGGVFDPEDIAVMATAFDRLLADFKLVDRDDPLVTMLAKLVIEIVRTGERDPERIRQQVLGRRS